MTRVRMKSHAAGPDVEPVFADDIVDVSPARAAEFVAGGYAEHVGEVETGVIEPPEAAIEVVPEKAVAAVTEKAVSRRPAAKRKPARTKAA